MKTIYLTNGDMITTDFLIDYIVDDQFCYLDVTYGDRNDVDEMTFKTKRHVFKTKESMEESIKLIKASL